MVHLLHRFRGSLYGGETVLPFHGTEGERWLGEGLDLVYDVSFELADGEASI